MSRYSEIVAELRRRIETGELAPGDRVPSTRDIIRDWGVAMATATKALTELRQAGLVRAVPGVGTVVESGSQPVRPARKTAPDQALTPERIVAVAIQVADAEGLAALSMRRVAADLGAATMSLYRHVSDKDDLLMQMMETAFTESALPIRAPDGWRPRLELAARTLWEMFRRHPWMASALSLTRPQLVASALPYTEWMLAALDGHGLDPQTAFTTHLTLFNYVRGIALNLELEAEAEAATGMDNEEWMDTQESALDALLSGGRYPLMSQLVVNGYDFDLDALFDFGLQRLLDGMTALVEGRP